MEVAQAIVFGEIAKGQRECCFVVLLFAVFYYFVDFEVLVADQLGEILREVFEVVLCGIERIVNESGVGKALNLSLYFQTKGAILLEPADNLKH